MPDDAPTTYRDPSGRVVSCQFTTEPDMPSPPGSPFRERTLTSDGNRSPAASLGRPGILQRRLVSPVDADRWAYSDLLDNEIRIGLRLVRVFGDSYGYPAELPRLIGYDIDADQPFLLLAPYRGRPVAEIVRKLRLDQEQSFEASLFSAVRLLEVAGVVHGRISPATTRWDEQEGTVQLTDFTHATLVGELIRGKGEPPWSSAEQVTGTGTSDPRDDVWSAGQVIYYVVTGRPARGAGQPPDPSPRGAALQNLLGSALSASTTARPYSKDLLEKLRVPDPWPGELTAVDPRFEEGRLKFDERRTRKLGGDPRQTTRTTSGPPGAAPGKPGVPDKSRVPQNKRGLRRWITGFITFAVTLAGALFASRPP